MSNVRTRPGVNSPDCLGRVLGFLQMVNDQDRLTTPSHWERRGNEIAADADVSGSCWFRRQACLFRRALVGRRYGTVVEIGAYPGHVLNWLCRSLNLQGTAIEYVPTQAKALAQAFPTVEILEGDFLCPKTVQPGRQWDVVFSLGLVEHWSDLRVPLSRHAEMTAPGGTCIVGMPLHDGIYGRVMRGIDPALHSQHGCYSVVELHDAFIASAGAGWTIEACCAIEGMGFWNCGLKEWAGRRDRITRSIVNKALGAWHRSVTRLPVPDVLRPNAILVARRTGPSSAQMGGRC
jgi:hypothetical protein